MITLALGQIAQDIVSMRPIHVWYIVYYKATYVRTTRRVRVHARQARSSSSLRRPPHSALHLHSLANNQHASNHDDRTSSLDEPALSAQPAQPGPSAPPTQTHLFINFLWNSDLSKSLTNSPFLGLSSIPAAWFLKMRSSSQRRLTAKLPDDELGVSLGRCPSAAWRLSRGLPVAISSSRSAAADALASASWRGG